MENIGPTEVKKTEAKIFISEQYTFQALWFHELKLEHIMIHYLVHCGTFMDISRGAQIPIVKSPERLN